MIKYSTLLNALITAVIVFMCVTFLNAQEQRTIEVKWKTPSTTEMNGITFAAPEFEQMAYGEGYFLRTYMEEVKSKVNWIAQVESFETENALADEIAYLSKFNVEVPTQFYLNSQTTNGYGKRYFNLNFSAFINVNGSIKRITSVQFSLVNDPTIVAKSKSYVTNSVLRPGTGTWYKVAVSSDGIYKIDRAFLASIGVNVNNLNSSHIHVYGNGDGRIPDLNSSPLRTDDLAQVALQVVDGGDNSFDGNDYILFYAKGPHRWDYVEGFFVNERNIYSDVSTYFININASVSQNRIQNAGVVNGSPNLTSNSHNYYAVMENDLFNYKNCGQRWYGDLFDVELVRNYAFSVPNAVPGTSTRARVIMGSDAPTSTAGSIEYRVNNQLLSTTNLPTGGVAGYGRAERDLNFVNSSNTININITFNRNAAVITGRLDKIELNTRRLNSMVGSQFSFRDTATVGAGNICEFTVLGTTTNGFVWDVTNRHNPVLVSSDFDGSSRTFVSSTDVLREFVASTGSGFPSPSFVEIVPNQNLHGIELMDYVIITSTEMMSQANRLAELHRSNNGYVVQVVDVKQIYNEFSSGSPDNAAIRHFLKMLYDRSAVSTGAKLQYVCLFGDGSFDPKGRVAGVKANIVPTYQISGSNGKEDTQLNIGTDDYFGFLDDNEGFRSVDIIDVAIGRVLGSNINELRDQVNKIEHYMKNGSTFFTQNNINCVDGVSTSTFGDWRTKIANVADFEDYFVVRDLEPAYEVTNTNHPEINVKKLYLDAYQVVTTVGGERFPQLNADLMQSFNSGSLVINYVGHGGVDKLSNANIINYSEIKELRNIDRLPLFVSSTCEFTRYDDPTDISAGEWMSRNPLGGAIALLTTTRTVTYLLNTQVIASLFNELFDRNANHKPLTFGEILLRTKQGMGINGSTDKSAFILIGDPGLKMALPEFRIVVDSINGRSVANYTDTLMALSKVKVSAHVEDFNGNILTGFNGVATTSLYDKKKDVQTLGQKPGNSIYRYANVLPYKEQKNVVYRGQSTVANGYFRFEFIVPKDIDYTYDFGKFSLYANSDATDAIGQEQRVYVGGINPNGLNDQVGPLVNIYLNSENFVNGGLTNETPFLIAKIQDESGINTVGNGIGHDITLVLDGAVDKPIILNDYYKNNIDSYSTGELRYQLTGLTEGKHTLTLKVWDVNNNSSEETIEFVVQAQQQLALKHVLNYPNPFTTHTDFYFEHNQCCTELEAQIQIFTVSGKLVKTINSPTYTIGYRSEGISWDGTDDFGDRLARGVYVYRLKVRTPSGEIAEKLEKLVLL